MSLLPSTTFNFPSDYHLGVGKIKLIGELCQELNMRKPLIVSDPGVAKLPWFTQLPKLLDQDAIQYSIFTAVEGNPTDGNVNDGIAIYRKGHHDGCILLGGGSAMDAGKCIALMAHQEGSLFDYEDREDNWKRIDASKIPPMIAIPTTAGTGSEVGRAGVIVDTASQQKRIIFHPKLMPTAVIADPELTFDLPPHLTAATGIDAFVHNFEAYCSPRYHPLADGIALEGMRLIKDNIVEATNNGRNPLARTHMLVASTMGATAFQKGLGVVHALAHPLGAHYNIHHGLANAILLPYCLAHNRAAIETIMVRLARHLELPNPGFLGVRAWVLQLRRQLGIPHSLNKVSSVPENFAKKLAPEAMKDPAISTNPRTSTVSELEALYLAAFHGDLDVIN